MPNEKYDNIFLIGLFTLTVLLLLLHQISFNKSLVIDVNSPYFSQVTSDNTVQGGKSKAKLVTNKDHFLLECDIIASSYAWPFCEISFEFHSATGDGSSTNMDLSLYENVSITAQYLDKTPTRIRFHLRTFNPLYSKLNDKNTWKYNGIEFSPNNDGSPVKIPLKAMQVPSWWLVEQNIPIMNSSPEFDRVMTLEIATGNGIKPGKHKIKVSKIEFTGKMFSDVQLYSFIIIMWLLAALTGLFINLRRSKISLQKSIKRTEELKQLNRLLNVETKEFRNKSERDPLTGALNRSGIEAIFTDEIKVLSLIFIDIDHFKPINDNYGHAIGDKILIEFVQIISENSRTTDFLARWGGEEFLLICPNTKLDEAFELSESLRVILSQHQWVEDITLTASFGIAQKEDETINEFIERADQALYTAKAKGRNTVVKSMGKSIDSSIIF
ncbi:GGDEF domain-containing protein [Colwellia sp. 1_MG-2023]|uniref:GGDEF domain-containing protein n=1 Tax=Colwellia sp. 1_MG-2023 TaxID=3062649 RepID=UPI0026E416DB|nr:GGDEF domain-containing protein [Colwellia sp. 1_MG-2023]MDO6444580.1 GGDEF domain-containing protein [Colwellia sp. 1_MG-2023]